MSGARFRFKLERVLSVREIQTLQARQLLAEAQAAAARAEAALAEARRARHSFGERLAERRSRGMQAWEWAVTARQLDMLCQAERLAEEALNEAQRVVAGRRTELQEAHRREEMLVKLQEKAFEAFQLEDLKADQAVNDELARTSGRFARGVS